MKHKHYEMIVAKAANMELVVLARFDSDASVWREIEFSELIGDRYRHYYLCLEDHKKECLHWLNGGESQMLKSQNDNWQTLAIYEPRQRWHAYSGFMKVETKFRIKPKKEKRWIAVSRNGAQTSPLLNDEKEIKRVYNSASWQHIEIDIEVEQ